MQDAYEDIQKPENEQESLMYCYCRSIFNENIAAKTNPYDDLRYVFEDGQMHCWDWFADYSL